MRLNLATVLSATNAEAHRVAGDGAIFRSHLSPADLEHCFSGLTIDSRAVEQGALFVALTGERVDGHDFVSQALETGAGGAIVSRLPPPPLPPHRVLLVAPSPLEALQKLARDWRRGHDVEVIGVTGSIGKTTTKEIIASVLATRFPTLKSPANLNTEIGLPLTLFGLHADHQAAVLEMGMYAPGDIALLAGIAEPHAGVITNVAPIHLERVGSIERVARAKSELVSALPPGGYAVLNADDPWTRAMAVTSGVAKPILVGLAADSEYRAADVTSRGLDGLSFTLHAEGRTLDLQTRVPGAHTVHAILSAIVIAREMGMEWDAITEAVAAARLDERQRILRDSEGILIIDDSYNAAPMSVNAALSLLDASPGAKVAVLGDMLELGPGEEVSHRLVGQRAAQVVDWLVARGPRSRWIAEEAQRAGLAADRVIRVDTNDDAVRTVRAIVTPGQGEWAILVKGSRGMVMEEIVQGLRGMA